MPRSQPVLILLVCLSLGFSFVFPMFDRRWTAEAWTIEGSKVYINDTKVYMSADPHTLTQSGFVLFNFTLKVDPHDTLDFVWGFDTSLVRPRGLSLWTNYTHTVKKTVPVEHWGTLTIYNVTSYYSIGIAHYYEYTVDYGNSNNTYLYWVNYTVGVNHSLCHYILAFSQFQSLGKGTYRLSGNYNAMEEVTTYPRFFDWLGIGDIPSVIHYDYDGFNTWYLIENASIIPGVRYSARSFMDVNPSSSGKYGWAVKPHSQTIAEAISHGNFYYLDPWWNALWTREKVITVTNPTANYQMRLNVTYDSDMQNDFDDLRFVDSDGSTALPYWIETKVNSAYALLWVKLHDTDTSINMYYGNAGATKTSNGTATWDYFLDWSTNKSSLFTKYYKTNSYDSIRYASLGLHFNLTATNGYRLLYDVTNTWRNLGNYGTGCGLLLLDSTGQSKRESAGCIGTVFYVDGRITQKTYFSHFGYTAVGRYSTGDNSSYLYPVAVKHTYNIVTTSSLSSSKVTLGSSQGTQKMLMLLTKNISNHNMTTLGYDSAYQQTGTGGVDYWVYKSANGSIQYGAYYPGRTGQLRNENKWVAIGKYQATEPTGSFGPELLSVSWQTKQSGWDTFRNTASWLTKGSGYNSFQNIASYTTKVSGYNTFGNSSAWVDTVSGYNSFGNTASWMTKTSGWNTFLFASSWLTQQSGYSSFGNISGWKDTAQGWSSFGNISSYATAMEGWNSFLNQSSYASIEQGWNTFGNLSIWEEITQGWNTFDNTAYWTGIQQGWNTFNNSIGWVPIEQGWNTFGNQSSWVVLTQGWNTFKNTSYLVITYLYPDNGSLVCPTCYDPDSNDTAMVFAVNISQTNGTLMDIIWSTWNGTVLGELHNKGNGTWHILPTEDIITYPYDSIFNYTVNVTDGAVTVTKVISFGTDTEVNCMQFLWNIPQFGMLIVVMLFMFFFYVGYKEEKRSAGAFLLVAGMLLLGLCVFAYSLLPAVLIGLILIVSIFVVLLGINKWLLKPHLDKKEAMKKKARPN